MVTLMQRPAAEREPGATVGDAKAIEPAEGPGRRQKRNPRVLLAASALLTGSSLAVPAAVMVFVYPLNHAEFYYADGSWHGEIWWSYVFTGMALSLGCGLAGLVLTIRTETAAYRTRAAANGETVRAVATPAWVALGLALLVLIGGPVVFIVTGTSSGAFAAGQWIGLSLLAAGLVGIAGAVRPLIRAASLVLPFAGAVLILGPWASFISPDAAHSLIGAGLLGMAVAAWGIAGSDPAVTRRWLLPFAIIAFVLALLGNAHMFLLFGLQHLSL